MNTKKVVKMCILMNKSSKNDVSRIDFDYCYHKSVCEIEAESIHISPNNNLFKK